jgi:hypothetical protein
MSGTVNIARSIFDHELFADQPLTEREAWIWLIMEAAWKPRKKRVGDFIADLSRGQLAASVRFMAGAWRWTPAKVQRFVKRLQSLDMILTETDTGVTVITICNYDEYQAPVKAADTGPIQARYRSDTNDKKVIREEVREEEPKGSLSSDADLSQAFAEYNAAAAKAGWPVAAVFSAKRKSALRMRLAEFGGLEGWRAALARARASPHCCGQNDRGWTASFDFLTQASSFTKLMEGNYDPRHRNNVQQIPQGGKRADPALEQIARLAGLGPASGDGRGRTGGSGEEDGSLWVGARPQ